MVPWREQLEIRCNLYLVPQAIPASGASGDLAMTVDSTASLLAQSETEEAVDDSPRVGGRRENRSRQRQS